MIQRNSNKEILITRQTLLLNTIVRDVEVSQDHIPLHPRPYHHQHQGLQILCNLFSYFLFDSGASKTRSTPVLMARPVVLCLLEKVSGAAPTQRPPAARTRCTAVPPVWPVTWGPPGVREQATSSSSTDWGPGQVTGLCLHSTEPRSWRPSSVRTTPSVAMRTRPAASWGLETGAVVRWEETPCVVLTRSTAALTSLSVTSRLGPVLPNNKKEIIIHSSSFTYLQN